MSEGEVLIVGRRAVAEALANFPERITAVLWAKGEGQDEILDLVRTRGIALRKVAPAELSRISGSDSHQGAGAMLRPRKIFALSEWLDERPKKDRELLVMIDAVQDPHNFGAILRSAECFGVDGVVWSKNRGVQITPTVTKVSVGASELVPLIRVSNLVEAARRLKDEGFWVVGAKEGEKSESIFNFDFPDRTLLIMGSEESGMQPLLLKQLDFQVAIPMFGRIGSLNVSQAAAVFLAAARRKG